SSKGAAATAAAEDSGCSSSSASSASGSSSGSVSGSSSGSVSCSTSSAYFDGIVTTSRGGTPRPLDAGEDDARSVHPSRVVAKRSRGQERVRVVHGHATVDQLRDRLIVRVAVRRPLLVRL